MITTKNKIRSSLRKELSWWKFIAGAGATEVPEWWPDEVKILEDVTFSAECPWCGGEIPWPYGDRVAVPQDTLPRCATCLAAAIPIAKPCRFVQGNPRQLIAVTLPQTGGWDLLPEPGITPQTATVILRRTLDRALWRWLIDREKPSEGCFRVPCRLGPNLSDWVFEEFENEARAHMQIGDAVCNLTPNFLPGDGQ